MKWVAWDPLAFAAVFGLLAGLLYFREEAPRWHSFFAAFTVMFVTAGILPILKLAHHPLSPGLDALIVMAGTAGSLVLFFLVFFKGYHDKPLFKRRGAGGGGAPGQAGGKSKSKKAPHHKALLATVGVTVFMFLLVSNWHAMVLTGRGGISQTVHGITS